MPDYTTPSESDQWFFFAFSDTCTGFFRPSLVVITSLSELWDHMLGIHSLWAPLCPPLILECNTGLAQAAFLGDLCPRADLAIWETHCLFQRMVDDDWNPGGGWVKQLRARGLTRNWNKQSAVYWKTETQEAALIAKFHKAILFRLFHMSSAFCSMLFNYLLKNYLLWNLYQFLCLIFSASPTFETFSNI